ncbi:hypothetical protein HDU67_008166 [Dinochytrium kinnereticum]|nr:hypothetical protein HDU67_008166 [Dinochytrium kinnereticum]
MLVAVGIAVLLGTCVFYGAFAKANTNASIPGPTEYPLVGNAPIVIRYARRKKGHELRDLVRAKHGNIYKFTLFGFQLVMVSDAEAARRILTGDEFFRTGKALEFCEGIFRYGLFFLPSGDLWRRHRKFLQPGFGPSHLRNALGSSNDCCDSLFALWRRALKDGDGQTLVSDLFHVASCLTLDVLGLMAFSYDFESVANHLDPESLVQMKAYQRSFEVIARRISAPKFLWSAFGIAPHQVAPQVNLMKATIQKAIDTKRGILQKLRNEFPEVSSIEGMTNLDVLDRLLLSTDWTDEEITDEVIALFLAGGETTANTVTFCMLLLHQHPHVRGKLLAEIDEAFGSSAKGSEKEEMVTWEMLSKLRYTEAVIKEALRLHPVLIGSSGRETLRDSVEILGHRLAKGTIVQVDIRGIHRDPRYWDRPLEYDPDRWMDPSFLPQPGTFLPFSDGIHTCLGAKLAMIEAKCFIVRLFRAFEFDLVPGQDLSPLSTITHGLKNGLLMDVCLRD